MHLKQLGQQQPRLFTWPAARTAFGHHRAAGGGRSIIQTAPSAQLSPPPLPAQLHQADRHFSADRDGGVGGGGKEGAAPAVGGGRGGARRGAAAGLEAAARPRFVGRARLGAARLGSARRRLARPRTAPCVCTK